MRARYPDAEGYIDRDGVKVFYEVYGEGNDPTLLLVPLGWAILHSRMWKAQIPYLARHFRVVTYDPRGNGRSDRPQEAAAYADVELVADAVAVMDTTATDRGVVVGLAIDPWVVRLAATHADRVLGLAVIALCLPHLSEPLPSRSEVWRHFEEEVTDSDADWVKETRHSRLRDHRGYLEHFLSQCCSERHSTKLLEDCVSWGLETTPETLLVIDEAPGQFTTKEELEETCRRIRCPVLVVHGDADHVIPLSRAERFAEVTNGSLVVMEGGSHMISSRQPIKVNLLIKEFVDAISPPKAGRRTWTRPLARPRRLLYLSSPISLGHALRDLAIVSELRKLRPEVHIDWLTQHPVTAVLDARGERVHPASGSLASESAHIEGEAGEHDLHVFQALRRMDEILVSNFMVVHELLEGQPYDLVVGDESWDVDYFWHENPELKRAPYVWMTDFVGWLPMPDKGRREAFLSADYNAEMIEHIDRFPWLRDRSIFVGNPDDIVPDRFGPDLPEIRAWTQAHYDFSGYVLPFDPAAIDRVAIRAELGYRPDEPVCLVTVGGSGVGEHLLRRVIAAFPYARQQVPGLRMVAVAGPRIDPNALPKHQGLEVLGFVDDLYRHMAACDLAVVQGGLSTTMELTALKRPFLYFPLRHHFEQNFHVRHRLQRYEAGRCMEYAAVGPESLATAMAEELERGTSYRDVEAGGATRAAALIAELI